MSQRSTSLLVAGALALCLIAGSRPRIVGDGVEYLAQALNFAALNRPSFGRQTIPAIERRVIETNPALWEWSLERASVEGNDRRRDFAHFWFYALLVTPFVWLADMVDASPLHAFTTLNLLLLGLSLRLALPRIGTSAAVLLFVSPLIWWIDKAHTEVFTVSLLAIALLTLRDRPWWALVAAGTAATQNPPIAILLPLIGVAVLVDRGRRALIDRRILAGAAAGLALSVFPPLYTYARHGTASLLLAHTESGIPALAELTAPVFDPTIGMAGNAPVWLITTIVAAVWLVVRYPRSLATPTTLVAACAAVVFFYSFALSGNRHHGGTPSLTRYALWLLPLSMAIWMPFQHVALSAARRTLTAAATVSALICVFAFHPAVPENSRRPTWLASWLWTHHPTWNNPLPEVFSETLVGVEGITVPAATSRCEKVLLAARGAGEPRWPIPCLPAPLPAECETPGVLCYANRRGADYDFVVAPGRPPIVQHADDTAWPAAAEAHVRRAYLDADWGALVERPDTALTVLRAHYNVRVARFGDDSRFLLALRATGEDALLHLRSPMPLRGSIIDASSGEILTALAFDGSPDELWPIAVPAASDDGVVLLTLEQVH